MAVARNMIFSRTETGQEQLGQTVNSLSCVTVQHAAESLEECVLQLGEGVVKYDDNHPKLRNSKVPLTSSYILVKQAAGSIEREGKKRFSLIQFPQICAKSYIWKHAR